MDIAHKVVVLTGASMGIGEASARLLNERGAKLALVARSAQALEALAASCRDAAAIVADLSREGEARRAVEAARARFGRIDVLINNAGRGLYGPVAETKLSEYRDIVNLNLFGVLEAMEAAVSIMREQQGGAIVNISSMVSKNYFLNLGAYASTKYALNALSLTARQELEDENIVVSVVYPGLTQTNFGKNAYKPRALGHLEARSRPGQGGDTAQHVASRIVHAIESGEAEVFMHQ